MDWEREGKEKGWRREKEGARVRFGSQFGVGQVSHLAIQYSRRLFRATTATMSALWWIFGSKSEERRVLFYPGFSASLYPPVTVRLYTFPETLDVNSSPS